MNTKEFHNDAECIEFSNKLINTMKENRVVKEYIEQPEKLDAVISYFEALSSTVTVHQNEDYEPVDENSPEYRVFDRLRDLKHLIRNAADSTEKNPFTQEYDSMNRVIPAFNSLMGEGTVASPMLGDLLAELLTKYGHDKLEDPNFAFLFQLAPTVSDVENLFQMTEEIPDPQTVNNEIRQLKDDTRMFNQARKDLMEDLYHISPETTLDSLDETKTALENKLARQDNELNMLNSQAYQDKANTIYQAASQQLEEYDRDELTALKENNALKAKANWIMSEASTGYTLNRLLNGGEDEFADLEEAIDKEQNKISRIDDALQRHRNIDKDIKGAEKGLKTAENDVNAMIKASSSTEAFKELRNTQGQVMNIARALELMDTMQALESKSKLMPALVTSGLLSFSPSAAPKKRKESEVAENERGNYKEYLEIGKQYTEMKDCLYACMGDKKEADKFFNELNQDTANRLSPMKKIREYFTPFCEKAQIDASAKIKELSPKLSDAFGDMEQTMAFNEKLKNLLEAENHVRKLKTEKSLMNDKDELEREKASSQDSIKDLQQTRLDLTNNFLATFEKEPVKEPMSYEALKNVGQQVYNAAKNKVDTWESVSSQKQRLTDRARITKKIEEYSPETLKEQRKQAQTNKEQTQTALSSIDALQSRFTNLNQRHENLCTRDAQLREKGRAATKALNDPMLPKAFASIREHISDAKRPKLKHTDTQWFTDMKNSLDGVENVLSGGTDAQKREKLISIRDAASKYLEEKAKQSPWRLVPSTMRKVRISYAQQLLEMSSKALNRLPEERNPNAVSEIKAFCQSPSMGAHNKADFRQDFQREHKNYVISANRAKQRQNNAPSVVNELSNSASK